LLSLSLFMLFIFAKDPDNAVTLDHTAVLTYLFYRCSYLHNSFLSAPVRMHSMPLFLSVAGELHTTDIYLPFFLFDPFVLYVTLPLVRSYGESSTVTLSPGSILI